MDNRIRWNVVVARGWRSGDLDEYRCERLQNGYVLVRDMASGMQTLYDPCTDALRAPAIHWQGRDLTAARMFVAFANDGGRDE
jgi:hypothetical protein